MLKKMDNIMRQVRECAAPPHAAMINIIRPTKFVLLDLCYYPVLAIQHNNSGQQAGLKKKAALLDDDVMHIRASE